ncbi:MFS transporter [Persicirhabdus sediminis]|uniref:MFS transporter n=1 Tax=Persicirhabdus sediminis TaxID=454144 RepID=A0A8J7ME76_9BACT|nr:MFS transporter [Persicirhabdus sediminis]MBK1791382.1 MFS transporter [Persicirhabdus sediminis]
MSEKKRKQHVTALEDRIPLSRLIAYGFGGLIPIALFNIAGQLMGVIGNIGLGLSAFWLGVIMIFPRLWDAVTDPLMGHISDNTRTRFGRRRPYILWGGLGVAISFVLMWWVPDGLTDNAQLAYILAFLLVFYTACTMFEIPHGALGMEMSKDSNERTRLFSAKSFFGNLFAMGTPWLIALATWSAFSGTGGTISDGMRYVSMVIAMILIPLVIWWFLATREPDAELVNNMEKTPFWHDMKVTVTNKTFIALVAIIFIVALGFNFVGIFSYYINIFYLYGGDIAAAGKLLGTTGTVWAVTGVFAVLLLPTVGRMFGKSKALMISILLMCSAQISKIFCYNPDMPYLVLIPTVLLSIGMVFFFTMAASMVADVCDEDDLKTGVRKQGSYYAVFWWFIKMGMAFASFGTGALLTVSQFDTDQTTEVDGVLGPAAVLIENVDNELAKGLPPVPPTWQDKATAPIENAIRFVTGHRRVNANDEFTQEELIEQTDSALEATEKTIKLFNQRVDELGDHERSEHYAELLTHLAEIETFYKKVKESPELHMQDLEALKKELDVVQVDSMKLKMQAPDILLWIRLIEIGVPLLLSAFSLTMIARYRLTEDRAHEIQVLLKERNAKLKAEMAEKSAEQNA